MPFGITPQMLVGQVAGLAISLVFAGMMYVLMVKFHNKIMDVFQASNDACEQRFQQLFSEFTKLRDKLNG